MSRQSRSRLCSFDSLLFAWTSFPPSPRPTPVSLTLKLAADASRESTNRGLRKTINVVAALYFIGAPGLGWRRTGTIRGRGRFIVVPCCQPAYRPIQTTIYAVGPTHRWAFAKRDIW